MERSRGSSLALLAPRPTRRAGCAHLGSRALPDLADERGRPFIELLARVEAGAPATVVDLGCGPGNLTALLVERWPGPDVVGVDSSPEMIAKARGRTTPAIDFQVADLRHWIVRRAEPVDVMISNATLQWVPGHLDLLPDLLAGPARAAGWRSRCPATSTSRATPSARARGRGAVRRHTRDVATAASTIRPLPRGAAALGCEVEPGRRRTCTCSRRGPGLHLGLRHRRPADAAGAARRPAAGFEDEFQRRLGRRTRARDGTSCFRSAGSSWPPRCRHEAPPRPGRLPAGWRGRRPRLLRRRLGLTEVEKPPNLRARAAPGSVRTTTSGATAAEIPRRGRRPVQAGPQGAPGPPPRQRRRAGQRARGSPRGLPASRST